jgi:rhodanese-related sulfurtransferase
VLSGLYVLRTRVFWHERLDELKSSDFKKLLRPTARRCWLVGFVFLGKKKGDSPVAVREIHAEELKSRLDRGEDLFLLDVRDEYEYEIANIGGHLIPLPELAKRLDELDTQQEIVALCKMGPRGVKAVELLQKQGFHNVSNLHGGIYAWSDRVDRSVRKY